LPGDNLVLDLGIDIRRNNFFVYQVVFAEIRPMLDDRLGARGTDARSSADAELMSTNSPAGVDLAVGLPGELGAATAGGLGDFDGEVVWAITGSARTALKPNAPR
jgi:hypothetical protein